MMYVLAGLAELAIGQIVARAARVSKKIMPISVKCSFLDRCVCISRAFQKCAGGDGVRPHSKRSL